MGQMRVRRTGPWVKISCPFSWVQFMQVAGLQMGQMAISRIESGKRLVPDFELPIIAEALNVSTDWLLGIEKG